MDNLGKIGRSLMDNWGKIRQLINILLCGYQRRLEIADPLNGAETYTRLGHSAPASNNLHQNVCHASVCDGDR
jgi:hypothetical protein